MASVPVRLKLEELTADHLVRARTVRVTDGVISSVVWTNSGVETGEVFVVVKEVTFPFVNPVRERVADLLIRSGVGLDTQAP